jgi:hypothetical protein
MKKSNSGHEARLLVLDAKHARILSFAPDGTDVTTVMEGCGPAPDGIVIGPAKRHIYWTNMGVQTPNTEHSIRAKWMEADSNYYTREMASSRDRFCTEWPGLIISSAGKTLKKYLLK